MKEDNSNAGNLSDSRRTRIRKIKNMIILSTFSIIMILIIVCIFLLYKVGSLQRQIDMLYNARVDTIYETDTSISSANTQLSEAEKLEDSKERSLSDSVITAEKKVYLTFDDGPSDNTNEILDILKKYNVKATFFVIGKRDTQSLELYKRIVDEGHTLGMHSYSHQYGKIYASLTAFKADFYKIQNFLYDVTGVKPKYYRFPGGSSNTVSSVDMFELINFLDDENITYFDWNDSNGDASSVNYTADEMVDNVINGISRENDTYVLMHDSNDKQTTVEALPKIIEELNDMRIDMGAIDGNSKPIQHINADM